MLLLQCRLGTDEIQVVVMLISSHFLLFLPLILVLVVLMLKSRSCQY
jgi:hypothetical protein